MRKFISTAVMVICTLFAINIMFVIGILSYKNIILLVKGTINISLVLEWVVSVIIFGILVAIFKYTDDNNYDHRQTPSKPLKQIRSCVCDSDDDEILERLRKGMSLGDLGDSEKLALDEWNKQYDEMLEKLREGKDL